MNLFIEVIKNSFSTSIPIVLLVLFRKKLITKYSAKFNYSLYILIVLKLIITTKIPIYIPNNMKLGPSLETNFKLLDQSNAYNANYIHFLFYLWLTGILIITFYKLYNHIEICKYINRFKKNIYDRDIIKSLETQKKCMNITKDIELFKLEGLYTPMIIGLSNVKIIIPTKEYKLYELDFIFKHELIHYKKRDNYMKLILDIITIIYWFNPLIYILNKYYKEQCEFYCDELVVKGCDIEDIKMYSLLLLDTIKYKNRLNMSLYSSQFNIDKSCKLKRRINIMFNLNKKKKGLILGTICSVITVLSVVSVEVFAFNLSTNNNVDIENTKETNLIKAVGTNNLTGYVKKSDLYDESQPQETLEQVMAYMEKKEKEGKRMIPLYDTSGNIIGEYMID